ncbi:MAG: hypothetical protein Q9187_005271 [Circinaria calcarea]
MALSSQANTLEAEGLTTLPLKKFSYVTTRTSHGKLLWTHLPQRDNLFAVFDFTTTKDLEGLTVKKRFLRFIRGVEILIRRLQINFDPISGYDTALELLNTLALPVENRDVESQNQQALGPDPDRTPAVPPSAPVGSLTTQSCSPRRICTSNGRLDAGAMQSAVAVFNSAEARPGIVDTTRRSLFQREITEARRPVTVSTPLPDDTLSQILPPKRILPFPDPPAKSNRQKHLSEVFRPMSDTLGAKKASAKKLKPSKGAAGKKKAAIGIGPSSSSMAPPSSSAPVMSKKDVNLSIRTSTNGHATSGCADPSGCQGKGADHQDNLTSSTFGEPIAHAQIATIEQGSNRLEKADQDAGILVSADWVAQVNSFMENHSAMPTKECRVEDTLTAEFKDRVNVFMENHGGCWAPEAPTQPQPSGLAEFTKLSETERSAAMDALIVECLDDDEFMCLVDEVDKSWQRVGWKL